MILYRLDWPIVRWVKLVPIFRIGTTIISILLFLVYITDISNGLISLTKLFADNCAIFCQAWNAADCDTLQEDLAKLYTWDQR